MAKKLASKYCFPRTMEQLIDLKVLSSFASTPGVASAVLLEC